MRHLKTTIALMALATFLGSATADEPAKPGPSSETTRAATPGAAPAEQPVAPGAPSGPDAWRYKRHQGLWWYWLPSNQWVYWHNEKWVPYDQKTYGELQATRRSAPSVQRSYSTDGSWGQWGPIRYDRYGNPQYPYSQRTRGMRQLGPVPTPAGVRSLPGWGGER